MHPRYHEANNLSREVIGAAIRCTESWGRGSWKASMKSVSFANRELELRGIPSVSQERVQIDYKGLVFTEELKFDVLIAGCLLAELKAVQEVHPIHKAQLLSYMKLLNIPLGLLFNFHEIKLVDGMSRMILHGADA
jgi:GxxExxY protein